MNDNSQTGAANDGEARPPLTPEARRALQEAEERHRQAAAKLVPGEVGGRDGLEPTRYGDWEKNGIVSDF